MGRRIGLGVKEDAPEKKDTKAVKELKANNETLGKELGEANAKIEGLTKANADLAAEVSELKKGV